MSDVATFPDGVPAAQRVRALITLSLAISVSVLGSALPNVALPGIARDLGVSPSASVWVVNAYQIAITITLLPLSSLGDIHGYRRVYTAGLALFTMASVLCTLAPNLELLVLARILQGLGAAGLMSVNTALVRTIFPRAMLGRGMGFNALVVATSSALGPTIASVILSVASWPYLFGVNVPIGIVGLLLYRALPLNPLSDHRFDLTSAALNALMFGLFIAALDGFGHGAGLAWGGLLLLATLGAGFLFVQRQTSLAAPMLPVDLFRRPVFALSVATSVCSFVAQTGAYVALPFLFQANGASAIETGLMMTPWPIAVACLAPVAGRLSDHFSAGLLGGLGLAVMTLGLIALAALSAHPLLWDVGWRMALAGAGFALFQAPNNRMLMASVPRERSGAGSGMLSTARLLGQTSGAALVGLVFHFTQAGGTGQGATYAVLMGAGFAALAAGFSMLRLAR